jgi:hypothetical protein
MYYAKKWDRCKVKDWLHGADDPKKGKMMVVVVCGGLLSKQGPERARFLTVRVIDDRETPSTKDINDCGCDDENGHVIEADWIGRHRWLICLARKLG